MTLRALPARARDRALLLGALGLAALAALAGGSGSAMALRGLGLVALLAGGLVLARRRSSAAAAPRITVLERHALGRDTGVAVLSLGGDRLLVGYGASGVTLLHRASPGDLP